MEYSEVTGAFFNIVVGSNKCLKLEQFEHASKAYFTVEGVTLIKIDNYLSCTSQYYIRDINA